MGIALSVTALILSAFSFGVTFFYNRYLNRRDLLLKMHQEMISLENQRGRGVLVRLARENKSIEGISPEDWDAANHALSQIEILGYYSEKKYIKESDVLDLWQSSFRAIGPKAQEFMKALDSEKDMSVWPHGRRLLAKAQMHNLR